MASEQDFVKELLQTSLSQVEDYAATIRATVEANLSPLNTPTIYSLNSTLLCIEELATQLENLVLQCKEKFNHLVPEPSDHSGEDDVDHDDIVPCDWTPPPKYHYIDSVSDVYYDTDGDLRDEFDGIII